MNDAPANGRYLSANELAAVIGCAKHSYACMRRHLERNRVPFIPNLRGFPQVDRRYYEARMSGAAPAVEAAPVDLEPNFAAI